MTDHQEHFSKMTVIFPDDGSSLRLSALLKECVSEAEWIRNAEELRAWFQRNNRANHGFESESPILFAIPIGAGGVNLIYYEMLSVIRTTPHLFERMTAGILVDGPDELYTKALATELAFSVNQAGCRLIGSPLVEATGSLYNFHIKAAVAGVSWEKAYQRAAKDLVQRLTGSTEDRLSDMTDPDPRPRILALHASNRSTSNTLALWGKVKKELVETCEVEEIGLRNGKVEDCNGCAYTTCLHYGEKGECFYGGVVVEEVYPALERAQALILLCANYNDALSGNISASINRLTALFRRKAFFGKKLFGIIVSGYSGGDIVARQLIAALNMNKSFELPPYFSLLATANDPGSIERLSEIDVRAAEFGQRIRQEMTGIL